MDPTMVEGTMETLLLTNSTVLGICHNYICTYEKYTE